jgi:colicin import membrane protein
MHALLLVLLIVGIRWQTKAPVPVFAELWSPVATPSAPTSSPPRAETKPEHRPEPKPEPKPPDTRPEPRVEKPDIALEQEKQRKAKEQKEREEKAREEKLRLEKERAEKEKAEKAKKEKEAAEVKAKEDAEAYRRATQRDQHERMRREAAGEVGAAPKAAAPNIGATTTLAGDPSARAGYVDKIRAKIKGNVVLPAEIQGNPEAVFDVVQLPTGEVLSVKLRRSSGVKPYDEAVERAILKSSPLPRPDKPEFFERNLELRFRPSEQ